ncbi:hypothetical protein BaRGS_00010248 [Batillaria attramentaria]|uniref:tRNA (guanine(9)-N(1))-methyltransferase n=1 Tax=Batillaria attramentaria TaxID=370345 RepID=A0ABD0LHL4_9CAEN
MSSNPCAKEAALANDNPTFSEAAPSDGDAVQVPLSKNQLKKQKKKEKWLQFKAQKRQAEKQKKKRRLAEMRERGEDIGPSRKSLKKNAMKDSACQQKVVIDCSFDSYMTEKDVTFLVQQIQHSYAANRRAENPLQLYVCGIGGKAKQRLDSIGDYKGWDIYKEERDYTAVFPKDDIVYLSSDSPNTLDTLDESKVYIIGGLVDHNHHKGLCHRLAEEKGLAHAQLPISQFLQLKSRKVLTINHVFEILLRYTETKDWQSAFLMVLPQRKGFSLKDSAKDTADKTDSVSTQGVTETQEDKDHLRASPDTEADSGAAREGNESRGGKEEEEASSVKTVTEDVSVDHSQHQALVL